MKSVKCRVQLMATNNCNDTGYWCSQGGRSRERREAQLAKRALPGVEAAWGQVPGGGRRRVLTSFSEVPHRLQDLHSMHCQR